MKSTGRILQQRIGPDAVEVEHRRGDVRGEVQLLPAVAPEDPPEVRRQDDERHQVERDRPQRVGDRLRRRPDRHDDIEQSKSGL
jgi:hypothetical protein